MSHVFAKIDRALGEKLPETLKYILENSGFDSESAVLALNSGSITEIEKYINENKSLLKKTSYEHCLTDNSDFKLKPGHRALLLNIPKALNNKNNCETEKKNNRRINSEQLTEEYLTNAIITKIVKYATDRNFEVDSDLLVVSDIHQENNTIKCQLQCPVCGKKIRCTYYTYWNVSNFQSHFRSCSERIVEVVDYTNEHSKDIEALIQN